MDGFIQSVGSGISGLVVGSLSFIGQTLRGIVAALDHALPGGLLAGVLFVAQLAKR